MPTQQQLAWVESGTPDDLRDRVSAQVDRLKKAQRSTNSVGQLINEVEAVTEELEAAVGGVA